MAQGDGEKHDQLQRMGQVVKEGREDIAHEQGHASQEPRSLQQKEKQAFTHLVGGAGQSQGRQADHHQHHHDVLDDQKADGNPPVQGVDLPFIGEELDDDDRAGKGEGHRDIEGGHRLQAQGHRQKIADEGSEKNLAQARGQRHFPQGAYQVEVEPEPHHEKQNSDPHLGQQVHLFSSDHLAQHGRPGQYADQNITYDQGLP